MDRYTQFGLRGDADEQLRRAVRDGFKRAGLSPAQLTQAMEWYRDRGQHLGGDEAKLTESFAEFAASKRWPDAQRDAAVGVYGQVRDQGPAAVMSPAPTAEEDAATLARAAELLRTDPAKYWKDAELQEAQYEALERQEGAKADPGEPGAPAKPAAAQPSPPPAAAPGATTLAGGAQADQARHDEIVAMMKDPARSREYWASPAIQQEFRDVLTRLNGEAGGAQPGAAPATADDAIERQVARQDVDRFAVMLRQDPNAYWRSPEMQQQHRDAIALAEGGAAPAAAPADPGSAAAPGP